MPTDSIRLDGAAFLEPFHLKPFSYVNVTPVNKENVTLDLVELLFKEQYLNGSDMWRFKMQMKDKCERQSLSSLVCVVECGKCGQRGNCHLRIYK